MEKHQLDWISIEGFKSIANSGKIELRPINLVIGANGSGKSNFIEVFNLLHALRRGQLQEFIRQAGFANAVLHFGVKKTKSLKIEFNIGSDTDTYAIELRPQEGYKLTPHKETVTYWDKRPNHPQPLQTPLLAIGGTEAGISSPSLGGVKGRIPKYLDSIGIFHVHDTTTDSSLRQPHRVIDHQRLRLGQGAGATNLAAFLYRLSQTHPENFAFISKTVSRVAPFFDRFMLEPDAINPEFVHLNWRHKGSDELFGASSFSDGTLRFIALTTLLLQPLELRPSVILIDEPELGLHPKAIGLLATMVQSASTQTQIILATQSPILLDYFEPNDVLTAEKNQQGEVIFKRLDQTELAVWLEDYSLGELWEKNYLGARP